jgi:sulfopyruvate decarboxylase subunit beta
MRRIDCVEVLGRLLTPEDLVINRVGPLSDDWWNHRPGGADMAFAPVILGSVTPTALGLAIALPHRRVAAFDTDGSILMNTGILATLGNERPPNLSVFVFDNEVYESIGSPRTLTAGTTDLARMAEGAGCVNCVTVTDVDEFEKHAVAMLCDDEMGFLVAKIEPGYHPWPWVHRKETDGIEDKYRFMRHVERLEGTTVHDVRFW